MVKTIIYSTIVSFMFLSALVSAQNLRIDNFSLKLNGQTEIISLKKGGEVSVNQKVIGNLFKDGQLKDVDGKTIAAISNLGLVTDGDKVSYGMIDKIGNFNNGSGKTLQWTKDRKFYLSEKEFLTVSPNKKKFYQTASFLIFLNFSLNKTTSPPTETEVVESAKFNYKDTDVVLSIETGTCQGNCDSLLLIYGNGKLTYRGSYTSPSGATVFGKTTRTKINQLLQKIEEIDFPNWSLATPLRPVHDGSSIKTMGWFKGKLIEIGCSYGEPCPKDAVKIGNYIDELFGEEIKKLR